MKAIFRFAFSFLILFSLGGCSALQNATSTSARKPNIIWIMADDMGYGDAGCYGQTMIKTPNIDRLASRGMRFTNAYAGSTVCAPSRCSLMTGLNPGHALVRGNSKQALRREDVTVAEVLKTAGYSTGLAGKWGLGGEGSDGVPTKQGFDFFYGYIDQTMAHNGYPTFLVRNETREKLANVVPSEGQYGQGVATVKKQFAGQMVQDEAIKFIETKKDEPFFLYYSPTLPHANNEAHETEVPDLGIYKDTDWPLAQKQYAAAITLLDSYVGQIVDRIKQHGLENDTVIFFTSDNGPHEEGQNRADFFKSSGPLRGIKRSLYDGGIREPMIVTWPGKIPAGRTSDHLWAFWDFLPTAAELAGATAPNNLDGISVVPILLEKPAREHDYLYWEFFEGGFKQAVRTQNWKAVKLGVNSPIELYDLSKDIGETTDVAGQHSDIVAKMQTIMTQARVDSPDWPVRR